MTVAAPAVTRTCERDGCTNEFPITGRSAHRKWCSEECRRSRYVRGCFGAPRKKAPANGYPPTVIAQARELGAGGWTPMQIVRILAGRGVEPLPTPQAVRWWLFGGLDHARQMEHQRRYAARRNAERTGGRVITRTRTPEFKYVRAKALRELGLSFQAVAAVLSFDLDCQITRGQVEYALKAGTWAKPYKPRGS